MRMAARALVHRGLTVGAAITLVLLVVATVSLVWTPWPPAAQSILHRLQGPSTAHWLGTDLFGRDTASMVMVGARNSLLIGAVAVGIGLVLGVPLGLLAAATRGWLDEAAGRLTDLLLAFPALLSAILITTLSGPGTVNAILAIGIFNIAVFARVTRAAALQIQALPFVRAAVALGRSRPALVLHHVLPNVAAPIVVQATIQFAVAILAEAALSYLGLGTPPPTPSWGKMLFDAQTLLFMAPGQAVFPGLAIALTVLGLNLLGDGLRDLLDPRLRLVRVG